MKMQAGLHKDINRFLENVSESSSKTIISLDIGSRKVGVAKGNLDIKIATPLTVISYKTANQLAVSLKNLITQHNVSGLVIGLPSLSLKVRFEQFINNLSLNLPFIFEDESYTTKIANSMLTEIGLKRKKRNQIDDKISAKIILDTLFAKIYESNYS